MPITNFVGMDEGLNLLTGGDKMLNELEEKYYQKLKDLIKEGCKNDKTC